MPQGVAGEAGDQLPGARDPGPTQLFPLHGGLGPDLPERMKRQERFYAPERQIVFPSVMVWVTGSLPSVDGDWKTEGPGSQSPPVRAPTRGLVSHSPMGHSPFHLDESACLLAGGVHAESPQAPR